MIEKISPTILKVGDIFKIEIPSPKSFMILKVSSLEKRTRTKWCKVIEAVYYEEAEDEYEEEDRYAKGDDFPYLYDTFVELLTDYKEESNE